ncbi:MAG: NADH-quinone oxidoreductase subunit NuoB [Candidatus Poribacteria bacterium]
MAGRKNQAGIGTLQRAITWARKRSLWYIAACHGCCAEELTNVLGCKYDIERFGCIPQIDPKQADLLFVAGPVSYKIAPYLKGLYEEMPFPKWVISVGSCTNCGGAFAPEYSYSVIAGVDKIIPIDIYIPGCPPRPEAIMNGLIKLIEVISGLENGQKDIAIETK